MADNDLELHVKTTADLAALREAEAEIQRVGQARSQVSDEVMAARQASLRAALTEVPPELQEAGGAFGEGSAGYSGMVHAAAEAQRSTFMVGANLTRARTEAIILARELATGVPSVRTLSSLLGSLGVPIAAAATAAIGMYKGFQQARQEAIKLIDATDMMGREVTHAGIKQQDAIKAVTKQEDVKKIADDAIAELDKIAAKNKEIQLSKPGFFARTIEDVREGLVQMSPWVTDAMRRWAHPYTEVNNQIKANAQAEEDAARSNALRAIERATKQREHVEGLEQEVDSVKSLEDQLSKLHQRQDNLDKSAVDYAKRWQEIQGNIGNVEKQLIQVLNAQTGLQREVAKNVKGIVSDAFKTPDQYNKKIREEVAQHQAEIAEARSELSQMAFEGGPKTDRDRARQAQLQKFISPQSENAFYEDLERQKLKRHLALQESLINPNEPLSKSLGKQGAENYRQERERLSQLDAHQRQTDVTGGRIDAGSREIATKLQTLIDLFK